MHSGSSISPKHPAIPVSIGIASLVLEGRSSALDDSSINASATVCATSSALVSGHGIGSGGGAGGGSSTGSGAAGGSGDDEEDGGFCGQRRASESAGGASSLQQCSLMAINESQKSLALTCCHTSNETQRINLKLQQIRSSCPSTSKDEVQQLVTVSGEPSRLSSGGGHRNEREIYESFSNVVPQHDPAARATSSSPSSTVASWFSHELPISASTATAGVVIYSGFEKMNVLGTVSPIKNHPMGNSFINFSSSSSVSAIPSSLSLSSVQPRKPPASSKLQSPSLSPREGPHCEQFLKKIGLTKSDTAEGSEHHCSYRNKYCLRWQVYFKQLSTILTNGEAVCIEVYLGPENHTILLEQWILKLVMTKSPATMTIQSLCAAIRSQLYFSQISAWTDLIKKSLDPDIFSHPRIKKMFRAGAAGGPSLSLPQAKLDILFRIRTYDNTACFNEKPNVHNFPDASVAENFVIQVCLKSLPRLDRIPGIDAALDAAKMIACLQKQQQVDRIPLPCHEKGKHRCAFRVELEEEEDEYDPSMVAGVIEGDGGDGDDGLQLTSAAISHREKQLLKYRKRMLKREKKKKNGNAGEGSSNGSVTSSNSSSGRGSVSDQNGSSTDGSSYLSAKHYNMCGQLGSIGHNAGPKMPSNAGGALGFSNGVSVIVNDECSNGSCRNALTSSINSIQPPLYSSNDHHQAMVICEDRFHSAASNSKSTQTTTTSGLSNDTLPPVVSVATQTDPTVLVTPVCRDCSNRSREANGRDTEPAPIGNTIQRVMDVSQNVNHASSTITSSSSTNRDRYMQYFNDYYRTYNIINENCDKGPAAALEGCCVTPARTTTDVPMEEGTFSSVQKPRANGTDVNNYLDLPNSTTTSRPCFIVGGDGYEGDEDDDGSTQKRNRATANGGSPVLQPGDMLLQAIQRTAMSKANDREKQVSAKNGQGQAALNNNNYTTANNNIVECETAALNDGSRLQVANGMQPTVQHIDASRRSEKDDSKMAAKKCESSECDTFSKEKKLDLGDCRLCKRQKTKHNFKLNLSTLLSTSSLATTKGSPTIDSSCAKKEAMKKNAITTVLDCGTTPPGCRRTLSESLVGHLTIPGSSNASFVGNGQSGAPRCDGDDAVHSNQGLHEGYPSGEELSPSDSPMLSSSTGAIGNGIFTFEQMKSYRRAFSEDVIDTITTLGPRAYDSNDRNEATEEDSTEDDGSNGGCDNENDHVFAQERDSSFKTCGCAVDRRTANDDSPQVLGTTVTGKCGHQIPRRHRPHTSTPAAPVNGSDCKEPLYISCSETDCSVSTASSVSPHKKQILSCAAMGNSSQASSLNSRKEDRCNSLRQQLIQLKPSSKINLNYVFCLSPLARDDSGFTSGSSPATSATFPATSPIAIDGGVTFGSSKSARTANGGAFSPGLFRYDFEETPISPVSGTIKSKSAPVFPFSPPSGGGALSPRFLRNAQRQFHHRTRYPSERSSFSERSSIGSDEQLSDDDLSSYLLDSSNGGSYCSPLSGPQHLPFEDVAYVASSSKFGRYTARSNTTGCMLPTTQMLSKVLNRNLFKFGRAPMLGTLEESLLQRRLAPKFQVADFKVLLGASGSFCPTQLTIPAASYFYELPGQHLTTPYVCELRLPRKGYSIPRTGTVQATLLNPLGTVVRMFVVPYDFRDMPAMSTTFIRQRILACDDSSLKLLGKNIEQLSNAEQMKLLRYAIHLRFQTSRSGKLSLHTDIRLLISRRTDCDTAAAHAKNLLESPNELKVVTIVPDSPKFSLRIDKQQ